MESRPSLFWTCVRVAFCDPALLRDSRTSSHTGGQGIRCSLPRTFQAGISDELGWGSSSSRTNAVGVQRLKQRMIPPHGIRRRTKRGRFRLFRMENASFLRTFQQRNICTRKIEPAIVGE